MNRRLYVGNLAYSVTGNQLHDMFAAYGDVVEATTISDRITGRSKGFGFVEMASEDGARKAIDGLNEKNIDGRNLVVNEARERETQAPRSGGFQRGGGGGRDRY